VGRTQSGFAVGLGDAALEGVVRAFRVGGGGLGSPRRLAWGELAEDVAKVEKVLMASAALREIGGTPLGDELLRGHGVQL